jgi:hypothetical protein
MIWPPVKPFAILGASFLFFNRPVSVGATQKDGEGHFRRSTSLIFADWIPQANVIVGSLPPSHKQDGITSRNGKIRTLRSVEPPLSCEGVTCRALDKPKATEPVAVTAFGWAIP